MIPREKIEKVVIQMVKVNIGVSPGRGNHPYREGGNSHMEGRVTADYHQDFVINEPDLFSDHEKVMEKGVWIKE